MHVHVMVKQLDIWPHVMYFIKFKQVAITTIPLFIDCKDSSNKLELYRMLYKHSDV